MKYQNQKRRVKYVLDKSDSTTKKKKKKFKRSPSKQNVRLKQEKKITKITKQFLEKKPFLEKPFSKFVVKAVAPEDERLDES